MRRRARHSAMRATHTCPCSRRARSRGRRVLESRDALRPSLPSPSLSLSLSPSLSETLPPHAPRLLRGSDPLYGNRNYDELDRSNFQAWCNKQNPSHAGLTPRSVLEPPSPRAFAQAAAPVGIPPPPPVGATARPRPRPPLPTVPMFAAPPSVPAVCASNESGADTGAAGAASAFGRAPARLYPMRKLCCARGVNQPACVERRIELAGRSMRVKGTRTLIRTRTRRVMRRTPARRTRARESSPGQTLASRPRRLRAAPGLRQRRPRVRHAGEACGGTRSRRAIQTTSRPSRRRRLRLRAGCLRLNSHRGGTGTPALPAHSGMGPPYDPWPHCARARSPFEGERERKFRYAPISCSWPRDRYVPPPPFYAPSVPPPAMRPGMGGMGMGAGMWTPPEGCYMHFPSEPVIAPTGPPSAVCYTTVGKVRIRRCDGCVPGEFFFIFSFFLFFVLFFCVRNLC